jgi:hypothetical protein
MTDPDPIDDWIAVEHGRAEAELLRLRARLEAFEAEPASPHMAEEIALLRAMIGETEARASQLEALAAEAEKRRRGAKV